MKAFPLDFLQPETQLDSLIFLLLQFHATKAQIFMASKNWPKPLKSMESTKALLRKARERGYIKSQPIPTKTFGRPSHLFFITERAAERCPEVGAIKEATPSSPIFNKIADGQIPHSLGNSQLCALLHRSVAEIQKVEVARIFRDHQFKAMVPIKKKNGEITQEQLDPDNFIVLKIGNEYQPLFVEGQRHSCRRLSTSSKSLLKSFQRRLTIYKVFLQDYRKHWLIHHLEREIANRLLPPKVIIHSFERSNQYLDNLRAANFGDKAFREVFLFAMLEKLNQVNILSQKSWKLTDGQKVSLLNH